MCIIYIYIYIYEVAEGGGTGRAARCYSIRKGANQLMKRLMKDTKFMTRCATDVQEPSVSLTGHHTAVYHGNLPCERRSRVGTHGRLWPGRHKTCAGACEYCRPLPPWLQPMLFPRFPEPPRPEAAWLSPRRRPRRRPPPPQIRDRGNGVPRRQLPSNLSQNEDL